MAGDEIRADEQFPADEPERGPAAGTDVAADAGGLGGLMADAVDEAAAAEQDRLEADALRAAEEAIRVGENALDDVEREIEDTAADADATRTDAAPEADAGAVDPRRVWLLRAMLLTNIALMGLVLALPSPTTAPGTGAGQANSASGAHAADAGHAATGAHADPGVDLAGGHADVDDFVSPRRDELRVRPRDPRFEAAIEAAEKGDYTLAIAHLEGLVQDPSLGPRELEIYYTALATYALKDGREEDSLIWSSLANSVRRPGTQPEDLLSLAQKAEEEGDGPLMRRSYARFLLMRDQLSPAMLGKVTEIYLRLGDSYRLEARVGAEKAASHDEKLLDEIRKHNEVLRQQQIKTNRGLDGKQFVPYSGKSLDALKEQTGGGGH
jgi:hypothetical protein